MILTLNIHYSRASDLVAPDHLVISPPVPITGYRDSFGNWCSRIVAPPGRCALSHRCAWSTTRGLPDVVAPSAQQTPVQDLPEETLVFLLGSRYCETDRLSETRLEAVRRRARPAGRACRRSATSCTTTSSSATSMRARTKTAWEAYNEGRGVCRDYAHLAIALLPLHEHPGALLHRLPRRHRRAAALRPDGFRRLVRGLPRRPLVHLRPAQQRAAHRPRADRARPRRRGRGAITTTFGPNTLESFKVWTDEVVGLARPDRARQAGLAERALERGIPAAEVGGGAIGRLEEAQQRGVGIGGRRGRRRTAAATRPAPVDQAARRGLDRAPPRSPPASG